MRKLLFILGLLISVNGFSQTNVKNDIIVTTGGDLLQVKVTKVTDGTVSFNYPGESVVNEINSNGIDKIVFSSGRTQNFKGSGPAQALPAQSQNGGGNTSTDIYSAPPAPAPPSFEKNTLAVVPSKFKRNGAYEKKLSGSATEYLSNLLSSKANTSGIKVLTAKEVVGKLVEGGVNYDKLRQSSPEELRTIIGTEYLMYVDIDENEPDNAAQSFSMENAKSSEGSQLGRIITLSVFAPGNEEEFYKVDFTEDLFTSKTDNQATSMASGKWKSALRYLTEEFFAANLFTPQ